MREASLPDDLRIPKEIAAGIDERYAESMRHQRYERGADVVLQYNGEYGVHPSGTNADEEESRRAAEDKRRGKPHKPSTNKGEWDPDPGNVGRFQTKIGTVHSHPYDVDSTTGTFSGDDLGALAGDEKMSFIRSGKDTMMVARTKEFMEMEARETKEDEDDSHDQKVDQFRGRMTDSWNAVYNSKELAGQSVRARSEAAMRASVKQYHLAYYEGQGQKLKRVKP